MNVKGKIIDGREIKPLDMVLRATECVSCGCEIRLWCDVDQNYNVNLPAEKIHCSKCQQTNQQMTQIRDILFNRSDNGQQPF